MRTPLISNLFPKESLNWTALTCAALVTVGCLILLPTNIRGAGGSAFAIVPSVRLSLAICGGIVLFWLFRPIPIYLTALLPLILFPLFGLDTFKGVLSAYTHDFVLSLATTLLLAGCLVYWHLDQRLALKFFAFFGPNPRSLIFNGLALSAFCSMWIPNGSLGTIALPVVVRFLHYAGEFYEHVAHHNPQLFKTRFVCAVAFGITIGGLSNIIGSPINVSLYRFFDSAYGDSLSLISWLTMGLVFFIVGIPLCSLILNRGFKKKILSFQQETEFFHFIAHKHRPLGTFTRRGHLIAAVIVCAVCLWPTSAILRVFFDESIFTDLMESTNINLVALFILFFFRARDGHLLKLQYNLAFLRQPWWILLFLGATFSLARVLEISGAVTLLAALFSYYLDKNSVIALLQIVFLMLAIGNLLPTAVLGSLTAVFFTTLLSHTPINNTALAISLTLIPSAAFFLPLGGLHNILLYSTGAFRFRDFFLNGALVGTVLLPLLFFIPDIMSSSMVSESEVARHKIFTLEPDDEENWSEVVHSGALALPHKAKNTFAPPIIKAP